MRNWNRDCLEYRSLCTFELPDYLWGIETPLTRISRPDSESASRLPMRNWNFCQLSTLSGHMAPGFQTTYEELKLCTTNVKTALDIRFQTTYEELKPETNWKPSVTGDSLPDYLWGIETLVGQDETSTMNKLPDYLWGIETIDSYVDSQNAFGLPDYLWGIETPEILSWAMKCICFQTTYEELKLIRTIQKYEMRWASRLPMRNWNKVQSRSNQTSSLASRLPMRNWNRCSDTRTWETG